MVIQFYRNPAGRARRTSRATAAAAQGAVSLYLQVAVGNQAARALYARTGFIEHHGYHYRLAPAVG